MHSTSWKLNLCNLIFVFFNIHFFTKSNVTMLMKVLNFIYQVSPMWFSISYLLKSSYIVCSKQVTTICVCAYVSHLSIGTSKQNLAYTWAKFRRNGMLIPTFFADSPFFRKNFKSTPLFSAFRRSHHR